MNPFETAEFRAALNAAVVDAIKKVGIATFKQMSWFASNEQASGLKKAA